MRAVFSRPGRNQHFPKRLAAAILAAEPSAKAVCDSQLSDLPLPLHPQPSLINNSSLASEGVISDEDCLALSCES